MYWVYWVRRMSTIAACCRAYREMDGLEHESLGKLAVSFCNPLKEDSRKDRNSKVDPRQVPMISCDGSPVPADVVSFTTQCSALGVPS